MANEEWIQVVDWKKKIQKKKLAEKIKQRQLEKLANGEIDPVKEKKAPKESKAQVKPKKTKQPEQFAGFTEEEIAKMTKKNKPAKAKAKSAKKSKKSASASSSSSSSASPAAAIPSGEQLQSALSPILNGTPNMVSFRQLQDTLEQLFGCVALQTAWSDLGWPALLLEQSLGWLARTPFDEVLKASNALLQSLVSHFAPSARHPSTGRGHQTLVQLLAMSEHGQQLFVQLANALPHNDRHPFLVWLLDCLWNVHPRAAMQLHFDLLNAPLPAQRAAALRAQLAVDNDPAFVRAYVRCTKDVDCLRPRLDPSLFLPLLDMAATPDADLRTRLGHSLADYLLDPATPDRDVAAVFAQLERCLDSRLPHVNNLFLALSARLDDSVTLPPIRRLSQLLARHRFFVSDEHQPRWQTKSPDCPSATTNFAIAVQHLHNNLVQHTNQRTYRLRRSLEITVLVLVILAVCCLVVFFKTL